jgi:AcrR family transcriptional regulator
MIYYHFGSKAALYREILHDMFHAIAERTSAVARSSAPPDEKIRGFIDAIAAEADARPHFPAIWFREIAEEAAHLDETIVRELTRIIRTLAGIIQEGAEDGRFSPVNPLLIHAGIVAPLLLYFASRRLRARIERAGAAGAAGFDRDEVVAYLQRVSLGVLEGRM